MTTEEYNKLENEYELCAAEYDEIVAAAESRRRKSILGWTSGLAACLAAIALAVGVNAGHRTDGFADTLELASLLEEMLMEDVESMTVRPDGNSLTVTAWSFNGTEYQLKH